MRKLLLVFFILYCALSFAQGGVISINTGVPSQIAVCGSAQTFNVTIFNPSPFNVTNDTLKIELPSGINYQLGSVSGTGVTEFNTSIVNKPVFLLPAIPSLAPTLTISFQAIATCDVIAFIAGGGIISNKATVTYTANNQQNSDSQTSVTYTVKQPVLSISSVTNQSYSGNIGDTYTRCITITNSGLGTLSQFTFTDVHGSGIVINSITNGNWTNSGNTETVTFGSSNFNTIGNNNGLFEQGEAISFCETVHINSCVNVASNFTAFWGCNNQNCQVATLGANAVFPSLIPNVEITPINPAMNPCLGPGNASIQKILITNSGPGNATNIHLDIFQTNNGSGYNNSVGSYIDTASFALLRPNSTSLSFILDSTKATSQLGCMPANAKGRVFITIPALNAGDTLYLSWNTYSCCYNSCTSVGQSYFNGWAYQGNYSNICQSSYVIATAWGRVHSQLFATLLDGSSTAALDSGDVGSFNFLFTSYGMQLPYPADATAHWKLVFTLPPCFITSSNPYIISNNGVDTWNPSSVSTSGDSLIAIFNDSLPPFDLTQARIKVDLPVDCNNCGGGSGSLSVKMIYVPSSSCGCEINFVCGTSPTTVLCSEPPIIIPPEPPDSACPHGLMFRYYSFERSSLGLPDNEVGGGNGIADLSGSLNPAKIKVDRAMFGDTLTSKLHGKIRTSLVHPSWRYCYAATTITNGNLLGFLDAQLLIYRNNTLLATCTSFVPTITSSGTTRTFTYDLSAPTLISSGCLSIGFIYQNSDSLVFSPRYKVKVNTNGPIFTCETTPEYYTSDTVNTYQSHQQFQCGGFFRDFYAIGYRFESHDDNYYTIGSCSNLTISQQYYLSIGPCCSNYNGGNLFPYEYRNWAHIDTLKAIIPSGYKCLSAQFQEFRTAGSGLSDSSAIIPLSFSNPDTTIFTFPVQQYFNGYGGNIPLSDDGFSGKLDITLAPSCRVTPVVSQGVAYNWAFRPTNYLTGTGSYPTHVNTTPDYIIYNAPSVFLQSTLPSVSVNDSLAMWDISLSNLSHNSNAENTWLSVPQISGVNVLQILDLDSNNTVTPTGNIYQLGVLHSDSVRHFRILATFNSCYQDSVILYAGWNCSEGYPTSVSTYPCVPQKITLFETPNVPALDMLVTSPNNTLQLCDTSTYTVEGFNFQLGTLYNPILTVVLPPGVTIVPGSSTLLYPSNGGFVPIANPSFISGTTWQWNLSQLNTTIGANGIKGFNDSTLNSFKIKFKIVTGCGFISGTNIHFSLSGNAACGLMVNQNSISSELVVTGATAPYHTHVSMSTTFISPCAASSVMHVAIANQGATAVGATDSVAIYLPNGVGYENNSFNGTHNAPSNTTPAITILNGQSILKWQMPGGVSAGDSIVFDFNFNSTPDSISCGISNFIANTLKTANVVCSTTGTPCDIGVITGSDTLPVFAYKGYIALSNPSAYSTPAPPLGETANISFDINNTGQDIFQVNNTIISYYYDSNANGLYDASDSLIALDTLNALIPANGSYTYNSNVFLPAGKACSIIAVLDTTINHCSCTASQLFIPIGILKVTPDTNLCSATTDTLGFPPINGYTYSWTPSTNLNDTASSSPIYTATVVSGAIQTVTFYVTTSRMGCNSLDTVHIAIHPNPLASVSGTDTICNSNNSGSAQAAIITGTLAPYTYLWSTTPPQQTDTATGLGAGTYTVTITDSIGCKAQQTFTINQSNNPLTVTISNASNLICSNVCNGNATAIANGGTPGYSYSWNTLPIQTNATATGLCADTFFVTITDGVGCTATDSFSIVSSPPILTAVSLQNANCVADSSASATISTSGGTPTFTYLWSNGQTDTIASGLHSGIYTITVTDANNCSQTDSAIITPPLVISITTNTTSFCANHTTPFSVTISSGTPTYAFLWNTLQTTQTIDVVPISDTTLSVFVTDTNGCTDSDSLPIVAHASPVVDFFPNDTIGCSPLCIHFQDTSTISSGANQFWLWDFGDGTTSNIKNPTHCFINDTIFSNITSNVSLTVTSTEGCSTTLIKNNCVTVYPSPLANFDYTPKPATILAPVVSFQNLSLGAVNWQWHFLNGSHDSLSSLQNPVYTYTDTGHFEVILIAINSFSCTDTAIETVIIGDDWVIYIPNAFSPNDDDRNDTFFPKTHGIVEFEMLIFDRWGNFIFETKSLNKPWDGRANNGKDVAQEDVYVYVIKATDLYGQIHKYRGTVTLVK